MIAMQPSAYDVEEILQRLISDFPELLPIGSTEAGITGRRWLLVSREAAIPDDSGSDRFSLDHLLLDETGVPTLVEVKRSTDTRIRREVVGQMLDYASHFVLYWTVERIQSTFEQTCAIRGIDAEQTLSTFLAGMSEEHSFWERVKTNMLARRIRLVFVADRIPQELRRIVEFLNAVTDPLEVLAVEVPQYAGQGLRTFVPRVLGQVEAKSAPGNSAVKPKVIWDIESLLKHTVDNSGPRAAEIGRMILDWSMGRRLRIAFGKGTTMASFFPMIDTPRPHWTFVFQSTGSIQIQFGYMIHEDRPFSSVDLRMELRDRINAVVGQLIGTEQIARWPSIPITSLDTNAKLEEFLRVWDWYVDGVRLAEAEVVVDATTTLRDTR